MDKLRRSFRSSFRKKDGGGRPGQDDLGGVTDHGSGSGTSVVRQWPQDEASVKANTCTFEVKYLGTVEVFESRGMQVCEEAVKLLKNSKRRPIKGTLHISGDGLRVADSETKGLVLDQTIEKVSFCAPDRNFERGFSYICRDGTTRRWMCHAFMAGKESGERLSHAVGCAFAICLEKKQRRDKECAVQMQYCDKDNTFTRFGSFRQGSISERLADPQVFRPADVAVPDVGPVDNPNAIARPRASDLMYTRQASFRGLGQLSGSSPFKRQYSLRLDELPSTLARRGVENKNNVDSTRLSSLPSTSGFSPISEDPPVNDVTKRIDLLAIDPFSSSPSSSGPLSLPTCLSPHPTLSPMPPLIENPQSPTTQSQEPVNPWDLVPDQPKLQQPSPRPAEHSSWEPEAAPLQPVKQNNNSLGSTRGYVSLDHCTLEKLPSKQKSVAMLDDPFDAEWANLATRYTI